MADEEMKIDSGLYGGHDWKPTGVAIGQTDRSRATLVEADEGDSRRREAPPLLE
jgi:hypothetical protein